MSIEIVDRRGDLERRARAKLELQRRDIDANCRKWIVSHRSGPMYWLRNWTKTENYHWREQGLPPVAPFPYKPYQLSLKEWEKRLKLLPFEHEFTPQDPPDYLDVVAGFLLKEAELYIPKTREMMTSWLVVGFITWFCQFYEKIEWLSQSEKDDKAQGLIRYANILYSNQEEWMKLRHPLKRGDEGTAHSIEWAHSSRFVALPQGPRQLASYHPYGYFNDETAHQAAAQATIDFAKPAVKQIVCVSSVAPSWFWNAVSNPL